MISGITDSHHRSPRGLSMLAEYELPALWTPASSVPQEAHCPAVGAAMSLPRRKLTSAAGLPLSSPEKSPARLRTGLALGTPFPARWSIRLR